ncbi:MAG: winged helix DNA-binding domain-containing protein [Micromonosporaceae bacterium]
MSDANSAPPAATLTRSQAFGYRAAVQHLEYPAAGQRGESVLLAGVRDSPPGRTADVALRVRGVKADPSGLVLLHSQRGAPHLHRTADAGCIAAALRTLQATDLAPELFGPFGRALVDHRISLASAMDQVAEAMRQVSADGRPRGKGELSTALNEVVDARLRPWCRRCAAHHVQDVLFRYATLQAGLAMVVRPGGFDYVPFPIATPGDPEASLATLVRRFLRFCGPCRPEDLGRWLALTPAAARRLWGRLSGQLAAVTVDGRRAWVHQDDLDEVRDADPATRVLLLPPYDPLTELADRELLLPEKSRRGAVWRPIGSPGILLVRGEIAGTYRQRATARRLTVTVQPFGAIEDADRDAARVHAGTLAEPDGLSVEVAFAT